MVTVWKMPKGWGPPSKAQLIRRTRNRTTLLEVLKDLKLYPSLTCYATYARYGEIVITVDNDELLFVQLGRKL